jgi:plastocyanin
MRGTRFMSLIAGLFAMALVLAACGGNDNGGTTGPTAATTGPTGPTATGGGGGGGGGGGATKVTIQDFAFHPSTITVSGPTEVTVTNNDTTAHTFTLDDGSADLALGAGESGTVTVDVSETTGFHCRIHPTMTGTIEVA